MTVPAPPAHHGPAAGDRDEVERWRLSGSAAAEGHAAAASARRGGIALPSLAAGAGLALSLPPWGFWVLAFPAAGLLWWRLAGLRPRGRLWAGWLAGLGLYAPGLLWATKFTLPGAVLLMTVEAVFMAAACLAVPCAPLAGRIIAFPAALTLAEAARMRWPFGGLPIGGVFLGQAGGPILGVARLAGPLGLTAAVFLGGAALAALVQTIVVAVRAGRDERVRQAPGSSGVGHGLVAGSIAVVAMAAAVLVAGHAPDGGPATGTVSAVAVQGGGVRGFSKAQVDPAVVLAAQQAETGVLARRDRGHPPALVLWPEDVVSLDTPLAHTAEESALAGLARSLHTTLVVGVTETVSNTAFRNEIVAFGPDGALVARFEKVHRVPFGEYVPDRSLFAHLANLSAVPLDAIPGTGSGLLDTPAAPLGALVSFEVFFADRGRSSVRHGAQLLIVPTNTSSYATAQVPTQEIAASRVQAVEQGRDLLQAAPTGYSAAITNRGVLLDRSTLGSPRLIAATLSRRTGWTIYVRYGDLPILGLAVVGLAVGWLLAVRRRDHTSDRAVEDPAGPAAGALPSSGPGYS